MEKIGIEKKLDRPDMWRSPNCAPPKYIIESLPFVENNRAVLIHRVQHITQRQLKGWGPHLNVQMWCGQTQSGSDKFTFHRDPPSEKLVCQRCENMAVLFGLPSSDNLAGRHVHKGVVKAIKTCCGKSPNNPRIK